MSAATDVSDAAADVQSSTDVAFAFDIPNDWKTYGDPGTAFPADVAPDITYVFDIPNDSQAYGDEDATEPSPDISPPDVTAGPDTGADADSAAEDVVADADAVTPDVQADASADTYVPVPDATVYPDSVAPPVAPDISGGWRRSDLVSDELYLYITQLGDGTAITAKVGDTWNTWVAPTCDGTFIDNNLMCEYYISASGTPSLVAADLMYVPEVDILVGTWNLTAFPWFDPDATFVRYNP